jgi:hypothetical protein
MASAPPNCGVRDMAGGSETLLGGAGIPGGKIDAGSNESRSMAIWFSTLCIEEDSPRKGGILSWEGVRSVARLTAFRIVVDVGGMVVSLWELQGPLPDRLRAE